MKLQIRELSLRLEQFTLKVNVDLHNARQCGPGLISWRELSWPL